MKKIVLAIAALFVMSASTMAQDEQQKEARQRPSQTEMIQQRTDETVKQLGLNQEQAKKLLELNTKYADKIGFRRGGMRPGRNGGPRFVRGERRDSTMRAPRQPREGANPQDMQKMREEARKAMEAYTTELKAILTEEQFTTYQSEMQKRFQRGDRNGRRQRPDQQ